MPQSERPPAGDDWEDHVPMAVVPDFSHKTWQFMAIYGTLWQFMAIYRILWQFMAIYRTLWQFLAIS